MAIGTTVKQYPALIDQFATWQDDVDVVAASIVNDVQSQLIVVETKLGTNPQGSVADLKTRLAVSINNDGSLKSITVLGTDPYVVLGDDASNKITVQWNSTGDYAIVQTTVGGSAAGNLALQPTAGNIGVGTTNPQAKLDVNGTIAIRGGSPSAGFVLQSDSVGIGTWVSPDSIGANWTLSGNNLTNDNSGTVGIGSDLLVTGKIGIGTDSPISKLDVSGGAIRVSNVSTSVALMLVNQSLTDRFWSFENVTNGTNSDLRLYENGGSSDYRVTFRAGGNVGIGITNPQSLLELNATDTGVIVNIATLGMAGGASSSNVKMRISQHGGTGGHRVFHLTSNYDHVAGARDSTSYGANMITLIPNDNDTTDNNGIGFWTAPTTTGTLANRMIIMQNGNVGIGTTNPTNSLEVAHNGYGAIKDIRFGGGPSYHIGSAANGTLAAPTDLMTSGVVFVGEGYRSGWMTQGYMGIYGEGAAGSGGGIKGFINFFVTDDTSTTVERMRINSSGNVGIGTTNPQNTLHIRGGAVSTGILITTSDTSTPSLMLESNTSGTPNWGGVGLRSGSNFRLISNLTGTFSGADGITIAQGGNVGIGSASPSVVLDVVGAAKISSDVTIGGNLTVNGTTTTINTETTNTDMMTITQNDNQNALVVSQITGSASAAVMKIENAGTGYALTIDNGAVGIGIVSPNGKLHVANSSASCQVLIDGSDANNAWLGFESSGSVKWLVGNNGHTAGNLFTIGKATGLDTSTPYLAINYTSGNVGIGTNNPLSGLHVATGTYGNPATSGSASNSFVRVNNPATSGLTLDVGLNVSGNAYSWIQSRQVDNYATNYVLAINPNGGKVGIGTNSPATKLQVGSSAEQVSLRIAGGISANQAPVLSVHRYGTRECFIAMSSSTDSPAGALLFGNTSGLANYNDATLLSNSNMIITSTGTVAIGTASPSSGYVLDVQASTARLQLYSTSAGSMTMFRIKNPTVEFLLGIEGSGGGEIASNSSPYASVVCPSNSYPLQLGTNYSVAMTINSSGNVGIGITNPLRTVSVYSTTNPFIQIINSTSGSGQNAGFLIGLSSNDALISNQQDGYLKFETNNVTRMRITNAGVVLVDNLAGSGNRAVYSDASGNLTNTSSDARMKQNVEILTYGLEHILLLKPVSYNWNEEYENQDGKVIDLQEKLGPQTEIGLIAQEVQEIIPEVVGTNEDATLSLDYPKLVAVLINAMKEQQAQIEELKARLEVLES